MLLAPFTVIELLFTLVATLVFILFRLGLEG